MSKIIGKLYNKLIGKYSTKLYSQVGRPIDIDFISPVLERTVIV